MNVFSHFALFLSYFYFFSIYQLFKRIVNSISSLATMPELTAAQRSLIQKTWEIPAANPSDAGVAILSIFFEKYPHHLAKFYSFKNTPLSELKV